MNYKITLGSCILFFLLLFTVTGNENLVTVFETFGSDTFLSTTCQDLGSPVFNYTSYLTGLVGGTVTFDNIWYCLKDGGAVSLGNTTKAYDKTVVGLDFSRDTGKAGIMTVFPYSYKIKNESVLSFSCRDWQSEVYLVFGTEDQVIGRFALNSSTSAECGYTDLQSEDEWCSYIDFSCPVGSVKNVTSTFHNIFENGSIALGEQNLSGIDWMAIETIPVTNNRNYRIDDLSIGFYNGSNTLPKFNMTSYYRKCKNASDGSFTLIPNISVFDEEGDIVYYAYDDVLNTQYLVDYDFEEESNSILYDDNFIPNGSVYYSPVWYSRQGLEIGEIYDDKVLEVDRGTGFYYFMDEVLSNFTSIRHKVGFNLYSLLEIIYYDGIGRSVLNLSMNYTNTNLTVSVNGIEYSNKIIDNFEDGNGDYVYVDVNIGNLTNGSRVNVYDVNRVIDFTVLTNNGEDEFSSFLFKEANKGYIEYPLYLSEFSVVGYGDYHNPSFSTSTEMVIDHWGSKLYNYYVSDSEHIPDEYNTQRVIVVVEVCTDSFVDSQISKCDGFFPFLCLLEKYVGNPLRSYYNADLTVDDVDEYSLMNSTGVWVIWFFLVIFGIVGSSIASRGIVIVPVVLGVSAVMGIIAYSVGFTVFAVSMMLIFTLFISKYVVEAVV